MNKAIFLPKTLKFRLISTLKSNFWDILTFKSQKIDKKSQKKDADRWEKLMNRE